MSRCNANCALVSNEPVFLSCAGGLWILVCSLSSEPHFSNHSCFFTLIFLWNSSQQQDWLGSASCNASVVAQESWETLQISSHWKKIFISLPNSSLMLDDDTYDFFLFLLFCNEKHFKLINSQLWKDTFSSRVGLVWLLRISKNKVLNEFSCASACTKDAVSENNIYFSSRAPADNRVKQLTLHQLSSSRCQ